MTPAAIPRESRLLAFWPLNILGWLAFLASLVVLNIEAVLRVGLFRFLLIQTPFFGFFITPILRFVYKKLKVRTRPLRDLVLIGLTATLAGTILCVVGGSLLVLVLLPGRVEGQPFSALPATLNYFGLLLLCWTFLYFGIGEWMSWRDQVRRSDEAAALAQAAQLRMLRNQINPHFLFNALNSIRALIDEDERKAGEMITDLSEFLRYSMRNGLAAEVPLREELEAVGHYFAIQKKRYEEKLQVETDIAPQALDFPILGFLVHPIIENAVKYGMKTSPLPLRVRVQASVEGGRLRLTVSNTGTWVKPPAGGDGAPAGTGTGLDNVRQRLDNAFPGRNRLDTFERKGTVYVQLEIEKASVKPWP